VVHDITSPGHDLFFLATLVSDTRTNKINNLESGVGILAGLFQMHGIDLTST